MTGVWPEVSLGELCRVVAGGTPARADRQNFGGSIPWVKIGDLLQGTIISTEETISDRGLTSSSARILPAGTVLLSVFATIGRTARLAIDAATNQAIVGLIPKQPEHLDARYLRWFLDKSAPHLCSQSRGVAQANINLTILKALPVPLPSIDVQRHITRILDEAKELLRKRRRSLALLDSLNQSIFLDMFGDPLENKRGWSTDALTNISVNIQIGPFGSLLHQHDYVEGGVPLVNPMHIANDTIVSQVRHAVSHSKAERLAKYALKTGDIIMARRGEMGRCAIVDPHSHGMICGSGSLFIRPDLRRVTVHFLHQVLKSPGMKRHLERKALGVTMANLNAGIIGALPIPLPPIEEQRRFDVMKATTIRERDRATRSEQAIQELFASLQFRAFAGQL